jgi:hypothetical protein
MFEADSIENLVPRYVEVVLKS